MTKVSTAARKNVRGQQDGPGSSKRSSELDHNAVRRAKKARQRTGRSDITPPSGVVTSTTRVAGIRNATLKAARSFFATQVSDDIDVALRLAIGFKSLFVMEDLILTDKDRENIRKALAFAIQKVPDSLKLPEPTDMRRFQSEPDTPQRRRVQQYVPQAVRPTHVPSKANNDALKRVLAATRA